MIHALSTHPDLFKRVCGGDAIIVTSRETFVLAPGDTVRLYEYDYDHKERTGRSLPVHIKWVSDPSGKPMQWCLFHNAGPPVYLIEIAKDENATNT